MVLPIHISWQWRSPTRMVTLPKFRCHPYLGMGTGFSSTVLGSDIAAFAGHRAFIVVGRFYHALISPIIAVGLINPALAKTTRPLAFLFLGLLVAFFVLLVWLLILLSRKGDAGPNRYGDPAPTTPN